MNCKNCETEFDPRRGDCPVCGAVPELDAEVLRREERDSFSGVTVEDGGAREYEPGFESKQRPSGIYVKRIDVSSGFWSQIAFFLIAAFAVFFIVPAFLLLFLVIAAIWFIMRLFR